MYSYNKRGSFQVSSSCFCFLLPISFIITNCEKYYLWGWSKPSQFPTWSATENCDSIPQVRIDGCLAAEVNGRLQIVSHAGECLVLPNQQGVIAVWRLPLSCSNESSQCEGKRLDQDVTMTFNLLVFISFLFYEQVFANEFCTNFFTRLVWSFTEVSLEFFFLPFERTQLAF